MAGKIKSNYDAIVIGSGPNGLSAAIRLAQEGWKVSVLEAAEEIGGGTRTLEMTRPGFAHDICSAVHPMGVISPFFKSLELDKFGLEWIYPELSVAHPLDGEPAVLLAKSIAETAANLGRDEKRYQSIMRPLQKNADALFADILKPLGIPKNPLLMARFGTMALLPALTFSKLILKDKRSRALFAGCAAHSILPFDKFFTSALGLVFLLSGHVVDWPVAKGGSQSIARALAGKFKALGGAISVNSPIKKWADLPSASAYLFDTDPHQLADIAQEQLPASYRKRLKKYHFGPGVFKIDYALSEPIPWYDSNCLKASTVHIGGTMEEIARGEKEAWQGKISEKPYVLLAQQSQFDSSRSPEGQHTCWAYCHVPHGCEEDMSAVIEHQIERFAPGFRDTILAKASVAPRQFEQYNPNYVGGAVTGGAAHLPQLFTRPLARWNPYGSPNPKIFICSASSPPGGGVHGLCGYYAAESVLKRIKLS